MEVINLKLSSGIDLIARVKSKDSEGNFDLTKIMQIQAYPSPQGIAVSLVPFVLFSEPGDPTVEDIKFGPEDYLISYSPKQDLVKAYLEQTSGLSLVSSSRLAPTPAKF